MSDAPGRPTEDNAQLAALGAMLPVKLLAMLRTARTHDVTNQLFVRQAQELLALVGSAFEEEDELELVALADYLYLNGLRLRVQAALLPTQHALMSEFERRDLGGVRFLPGVNEAELERFFQLLIASEGGALGERLVETCREASIQHVVPVPKVELETDDLLTRLGREKDPGERTRAKKVYWRAVLGAKKVILKARQTGRADLRHAKRLVQPIVDSVMKHEHAIVGLTAIKDHDEYTYAHCVNVSVFSVSMGQQLGMGRQALADLGVAALLHDLGKLAVPPEVLRKPGPLTPQEWSVMRRHPLEGVKMLTRMPGLSSLTLDAMRVAFEHHMNLDRTGYPDAPPEWKQSTLSRIVAVADCFDAITAHRVYHKRAMSTFEGLALLMGPVRVQFDPAALWALLKTVGLYPPGTAMVLDSRHVVLSLHPNPEDPRRPAVRVLMRPDGTVAPEDPAEDWIPLSKERTVLRVLPPEEVGVKTGEYLAA
jgi:HD-GYP domain-containing protein (c-di-GMP phosphodiesterase class II)